MKSTQRILLTGVLLSAITLSHTLYAQNVGVGTDSPDASAMLDVSSTDKGLLIPRMSSTDRQNIVDPATGLMVYDSTNKAFYYFTGNGWLELLAGSADRIVDADGDTKIEMEQSPDQDVMHLTVGGTSVGNIRKNANGVPLFWFTSGNGSLILGEHSGTNLTAGLSNTFYGFGAGTSMVNGTNNVLIGRQAGKDNLHGSSNTMLGTYSGYFSEGTGNVFIGFGAGFDELGNDKLYINNSGTGSPLIYGEFNNDLLRINGTLDINNAYTLPTIDGLENQVLQTNGEGVLGWAFAAPDTMSLLADGDADTKINLEQTPDEDIIRFDLAGTEYFSMHQGRIDVLNTGNSIYIGDSTGVNDDFSDNRNIGLGTKSLGKTSTGFSNIGIGYQTLFENTTGWQNIAMGYHALYENTTGNNNIAMGFGSLGSSTTGYNNGAIGYYALHHNIDGHNNFGLANFALQNNTTGDYNYAVGNYALQQNSVGSFNSAFGNSALEGNVSGSYNAAFGSNANVLKTGLSFASAIGPNALVGCSDCLVLGDTAKINVGIGTATPDTTFHVVGQMKYQDGHQTDGYVLTSDSAGNAEWALPGIATVISDADNDTKMQVEENPDEDIIRFDLAGTEYFSMHPGRLDFLNNGNSVFLGFEAGFSDDFSDNRNAGVGHQVLKDNTTGRWNSALGYAALRGNTTGEFNVAIGFAAQSPVNATGSDNIAIGKYALLFNSSGDNNVAVGSNAGMNVTSGSGNVFIGYDVGKGQNVSNRLMIDNSDTTESLIYGEFDNHLVRINGDLEVTGIFPVGDAIADADTDTKIQVEKNPDEDVIRFDLEGSEYFTMEKRKLSMRDDVYGLGNTYTLQFQGSGTTSSIANIFPSDSPSPADGDFKMQFDVKGNTAFTLTGDGNAGIGIADPAEKLEVASDTDVAAILGRARVGEISGQIDVASFSHIDYNSLNGYALRQNASGATSLNSAPGQALELKINNVAEFVVESDGVMNTKGNWISGDGDAEGIVVNANGSIKMNYVLGIGTNANTNYALSAKNDASYRWVANFENLGYSDPDSDIEYHGIYIQAGRDVNNNANSDMITMARPDGTLIGGIIQNNANTIQLVTSSDQRLKSNITPTHFTLEDLMKIEVSDYVYRDEPGAPATGFIAQQLYDVYPNAVHEGGDDPKTAPWMVDYAGLTPLLVKSIQDQQQQIAAQEDRILELEKALAEIRMQSAR